MFETEKNFQGTLKLDSLKTTTQIFRAKLLTVILNATLMHKIDPQRSAMEEETFETIRIFPTISTSFYISNLKLVLVLKVFINFPFHVSIFQLCCHGPRKIVNYTY